MEEIVEIADRYYILAGSSAADQRRLVLKHGETFGVFASSGDIDSARDSAEGIFTEGMRFLSRLDTRLQGVRPLVLSSSVTSDNTRLLADLTNPDISRDGRVLLARGTVHMSRSKYIYHGACFEKITLTSFATQPVDLTLGVRFHADFKDIFEIRGMHRERRGHKLAPIVRDCAVELGYEGLDQVARRTRLEFDPAPDHLMADDSGKNGEAMYHLHLEAGASAEIFVTIRCTPGEPAPGTYAQTTKLVEKEIRSMVAAAAKISTSNEQLNSWLNRSLADINLLLTSHEKGMYPYAGIPWYSTPFGRDGIITAMQMLWVNPEIAQGTLAFLADVQAQDHDPARDAQPGKILHEWRTDEMSNVREVPFGRYYGTVDATPLFVALAGAYYQATGDREFVEGIWPNVERAIGWMDRYGDLDGDGLLEYQSEAENGLANQGWKDSHDAIFHADGRYARGPIALCEVQGYAYDAKVRASELARVLGHHQRSVELSDQALELKLRFHSAFWNEQMGTYALALDGDKSHCAIRTSNAGHCLFSGIADEAAAVRVASVLMGRSMFSGWGIRTVSSSEFHYNPMSYHNGSIWPHDNALIAAGMARYGFRQEALKLFSCWLDASMHLDLHRLPELFCGFRRVEGNGPTLYPVACSPQAWASGAAFMMLAACLGLSVDGVRRIVRIHKPTLPESVQRINITDLRVGSSMVDLLFHRDPPDEDVGVLVRRRQGPVSVQIEK
jgi:glycogen debranching enzyme